MTRVMELARSVRWYVRELTGEAKWDDYVAECAAFGEVVLDIDDEQGTGHASRVRRVSSRCTSRSRRHCFEGHQMAGPMS